MIQIKPPYLLCLDCKQEVDIDDGEPIPLFCRKCDAQRWESNVVEIKRYYGDDCTLTTIGQEA